MTAPPIWDDLPAAVRKQLDVDFTLDGAPAPVPGGHTPGVRVRVSSATEGLLFIKAIRADAPQAVMYRNEAAVGLHLPIGLAPRLHAVYDDHDWVVLVFEHLAGRHPNLSPGSGDLHLVLAAVAGLHDHLTPNPWPEAADIRTNPVFAGNATLAAAAQGNALLHLDLRADNIIITRDDTVRVIDWAWPTQGAPWLDTAFLIPQLLLAGHTPAEAEAQAQRVPAYRHTPPEAVTSFASALTTYWQQRAGEGDPALRAYRGRAIEVGRAWITHRTRGAATRSV